MQILTYSSIYPNNIDPSHGIYVERRLRELVSRGNIRSTVIAPVPWFPFRGAVFRKYAGLAAISRRDRRFEIDVLHCRYPVIPIVGMNWAPFLMASATARVVQRCVREQGVTLIDAHYFYPDGVAASILATKLGLPFVITARGSDVNLIAKSPSPKKQMLKAAEGAHALVAVSEALAEKMRMLGMPPSKIHVLKNGVDLTFFSPSPDSKKLNEESSREFNFISVGTLKPSKGHDIAIDFIQHVPDARLTIIGRGAAEPALRALAVKSGVSDRVSFTGTITPEELRERYRSADALILMSEREGMPNVVLESLACGTPVLVTQVGGIPEIVCDPACGEIVESRDAESLLRAWRKLAGRDTDRKRVRLFANRFSWDETIYRLQGLMHDAVKQR